MKRITKEQLRSVLRLHTLMHRYRGDKLVGYRCGVCNSVWRGRKEKHQPDCVLSKRNEELTDA